jgi:hypothetical protein
MRDNYAWLFGLRAIVARDEASECAIVAAADVEESAAGKRQEQQRTASH